MIDKIEINDVVSYGVNGVCKIVKRDFFCLDGFNEEEYYQLKSVGLSTETTYYVPVETAAERLRPIISKDKVDDLIQKMKDMQEDEPAWNTDNRERRSDFQAALKSDDYDMILEMMHVLHIQQEKRRNMGHTLSTVDGNLLKQAEDRMYREFSVVLGISVDEVPAYIEERV